MISKPLTLKTITLDLIKEVEDTKNAILNQDMIYKDANVLLRLCAEIIQLRRVLSIISQ
ncbi:MAG: hypothetical protein ACFFAU_12675 [Candidatus Hodarchaeota archaeon]